MIDRESRDALAELMEMGQVDKLDQRSGVDAIIDVIDSKDPWPFKKV